MKSNIIELDDTTASAAVASGIRLTPVDDEEGASVLAKEIGRAKEAEDAERLAQSEVEGGGKVARDFGPGSGAPSVPAVEPSGEQRDPAVAPRTVVEVGPPPAPAGGGGEQAAPEEPSNQESAAAGMMSVAESLKRQQERLENAPRGSYTVPGGTFLTDTQVSERTMSKPGMEAVDAPLNASAELIADTEKVEESKAEMKQAWLSPYSLETPEIHGEAIRAERERNQMIRDTINEQISLQREIDAHIAQDTLGDEIATTLLSYVAGFGSFLMLPLPELSMHLANNISGLVDKRLAREAGGLEKKQNALDKRLDLLRAKGVSDDALREKMLAGSFQALKNGFDSVDLSFMPEDKALELRQALIVPGLQKRGEIIAGSTAVEVAEKFKTTQAHTVGYGPSEKDIAANLEAQGKVFANLGKIQGGADGRIPLKDVQGKTAFVEGQEYYIGDSTEASRLATMSSEYKILRDNMREILALQKAHMGQAMLPTEIRNRLEALGKETSHRAARIAADTRFSDTDLATAAIAIGQMIPTSGKFVDLLLTGNAYTSSQKIMAGYLERGSGLVRERLRTLNATPITRIKNGDYKVKEGWGGWGTTPGAVGSVSAGGERAMKFWAEQKKFGDK